MAFMFPEELLNRGRREAESRSVPFARLMFKALTEYLDALDAADKTPAALKNGMPRKRMLGDTSLPPPPDPEDGRRRRPSVNEAMKKAG
jgi:hypothetical protein